MAAPQYTKWRRRNHTGTPRSDRSTQPQDSIKNPCIQGPLSDHKCHACSQAIHNKCNSLNIDSQKLSRILLIEAIFDDDDGARQSACKNKVCVCVSELIESLPRRRQRHKGAIIICLFAERLQARKAERSRTIKEELYASRLLTSWLLQKYTGAQRDETFSRAELKLCVLISRCGGVSFCFLRLVVFFSSFRRGVYKMALNDSLFGAGWLRSELLIEIPGRRLEF